VRSHALALVLVAATVLLAAMAGGAAAAPTTDEVFRRYSGSVVRIRVTARGSGAKAVIGSGFVVRPGLVVTNYHVVSNLVLYPERYLVETVTGDDTGEPLEIVALDVVHDLCALRGATARTSSLELAGGTPAQGARLYALGHPHDLGLSIVEGTFNGRLEHSLYEHLHFTGSLNPGMSGGPTITARGEVVGVNVSSAGNQVSFLVPVERVRALLARAAAADRTRPSAWIDVVREQLMENERRYFANLLAANPLPTTTLAGVVLPGQIAPFVKCWANTESEESKPYVTTRYECSTDDYVFVSDRLVSGVVRYHHDAVTSDRLNPFQMTNLLSQHFASDYGIFFGTEDDVTRFRCRTRFVDGGIALKTVLCLRTYKRLPGLVDAVLKAATLGGGSHGAATSLALSGVSAETVAQVARRYIGAIAWAK
jgi:S1-C subfamily serine protease